MSQPTLARPYVAVHLGAPATDGRSKCRELIGERYALTGRTVLAKGRHAAYGVAYRARPVEDRAPVARTNATRTLADVEATR